MIYGHSLFIPAVRGGTIGQAEAGLMSGEDFELSGGFRTPAGLGPAACSCGDVDRGGRTVNLGDFATFAIGFDVSTPHPPGCDAAAFACSDMDASGAVDLGDFATFAVWVGLQSAQAVPNCEPEQLMSTGSVIGPHAPKAPDTAGRATSRAPRGDLAAYGHQGPLECSGAYDRLS